MHSIGNVGSRTEEEKCLPSEVEVYLPSKTSYRLEVNELALVCYEIAKKVLAEDTYLIFKLIQRPWADGIHIDNVTDNRTFAINFGTNPQLQYGNSQEFELVARNTPQFFALYAYINTFLLCPIKNSVLF